MPIHWKRRADGSLAFLTYRVKRVKSGFELIHNGVRRGLFTRQKDAKTVVEKKEGPRAARYGNYAGKNFWQNVAKKVQRAGKGRCLRWSRGRKRCLKRAKSKRR